MRGPRLVAAALLAAATCAAPAQGAPVGGLSLAGCYTGAASGCATSGLPQLVGVDDVAVSPDGRNVYAVAFSSGAITAFARDPATGGLGRIGCVTSATGCGAAVDGKASLAEASRLAISPDGRDVYVTGAAPNAVTALARDPATGALSYVGCVTGAAGGCGAGNVSKPGLQAPAGVAVTPDGATVLVAASGSSSLAWFARDGQTGALTYAGCFQSGTGCGSPMNVVGLGGSTGVTVSPDGRHVYVAANASEAIARFTRDPQAGTLGYDGCLTAGSGCPGGPQGVASLTQAIDVTVDPAGRSVYAIGQGPSHALADFDLDGASGALALRGCFDAGAVCGSANDGIHQLLAPKGIAVSADGRSLYLVAQTDSALVRFDRDPRDGSLARRDCFTQMTGCGIGRDGVDELTNANHVAVAPDGRDVYVSAAVDGVLDFRRVRDVPPGCTAPVAVATAPGRSVRILLQCGDVNGDAFSVRFPEVPAHGALTRSADGGSVLYAPSHGFRGTDRFSIQGVDVYGTAGSAAAVKVIVGDVATKLTRLTLTPTRFRAAGRGGSIASRRRPPIGTKVSYRLDRPATATFTVTRRLPGVRRGRRCVAPPRRHAKGARPKRCTRTLKLGSFRRASRAGANAFRFTGRVGRHALAPGAYTLSAVAAAPGAKRSRAVAKVFVIAR